MDESQEFGDDGGQAQWRRPRRPRRPRPQPQTSPGRSEVFVPVMPGTTIRVRYPGPGGGALNIYCGDDIALHVNPRPHEGLVLNSHLGGGWGREERPGGFPFDAGVEITLSVWAGPEGFHIQAAAAGWRVPFCYLYAYRTPESHELDRVTVDVPGMRAFTIQPEL